MKTTLWVTVFAYLAMTVFYVSWRMFLDLGSRPQEWSFMFGPISWLCCTCDLASFGELERNFLIATGIFWAFLLGAFFAWKRSRIGAGILLLICVAFWLWNGMVVSAGSV